MPIPRSSDAFKKYAFPVVFFVIVIVLSLMKIHGASIGMYNHIFYGEDNRDPDLLYGVPRGIRSDEWLVWTPWTLSQTHVGFSSYNNLFVAGQNFAQNDVPVASWITIFEPQNWAFFALPLEHAYAFRWWFKAFLLAVSFYFLGITITGKNYLVSALAALSFLFSPYVQWWYSTFVTEIPSFGILTFLFFIGVVTTIKKPFLRLINTFFFVYFAICFILTFYPPFQIPIAIFLALAGAGYIISKHQEIGAKDLRKIGLIILISVALIGIVLAFYYFENQQSIYVMMHTAYPGARQSVGRDPTFLLKVMSGFYNIQLQNDTRLVPEIMENQCEASSFFFLSLFLVPYYLFYMVRSLIQRKPFNYLVLMFILSLLIFCTWGILGLPSIVAKLLLLNYVTPKRMLLGLGLINHVLILYYLLKVQVSQTPKYKIGAFLYSVVVFITVLGVGNYIKNRWPTYLSQDENLIITMIALIVGMMTLLLLYKRKIAFFSIFLFFTLGSTIYVNPLYRGLSPLKNERIVEVIEEINDPQAIWLAYEDNLLANYLAANGVRVVNGTYYSPNIAFWSQFDPENQYTDIYNRYEHIMMTPSTDPQKIEFELLQFDVINIKISPCHPQLSSVGVDYFVFHSLHDEFPCISLKKTIEFPNLSIFIYEKNTKE